MHLMSAQFKVKIKLHISLFLTKYQLQDRESYRYLYLQLIIKQNLVFTKLIHLIFKTQKYVIDSYSLNVCINIINICRKNYLSRSCTLWPQFKDFTWFCTAVDKVVLELNHDKINANGRGVSHENLFKNCNIIIIQSYTY